MEEVLTGDLAKRESWCEMLCFAPLTADVLFGRPKYIYMDFNRTLIREPISGMATGKERPAPADNPQDRPGQTISIGSRGFPGPPGEPIQGIEPE